MGIEDFTDVLEPVFESLRTYDIDALKAERIRARCLVELEAQRGHSNRARFAAWQRWLEPAAAFALSALYIAAAIGSSLHLFR